MKFFGNSRSLLFLTFDEILCTDAFLFFFKQQFVLTADGFLVNKSFFVKNRQQDQRNNQKQRNDEYQSFRSPLNFLFLVQQLDLVVFSLYIKLGQRFYKFLVFFNTEYAVLQFVLNGLKAISLIEITQFIINF